MLTIQLIVSKRRRASKASDEIYENYSNNSNNSSQSDQSQTHLNPNPSHPNDRNESCECGTKASEAIQSAQSERSKQYRSEESTQYTRQEASEKDRSEADNAEKTQTRGQNCNRNNQIRHIEVEEINQSKGRANSANQTNSKHHSKLEQKMVKSKVNYTKKEIKFKEVDNEGRVWQSLAHKSIRNSKKASSHKERKVMEVIQCAKLNEIFGVEKRLQDDLINWKTRSTTTLIGIGSWDFLITHNLLVPPGPVYSK